VLLFFAGKTFLKVICQYIADITVCQYAAGLYHPPETCVKELPCFDALQKGYPDAVSVVAIHSDLVTEDVDQYLSGYDYEIPFALDEDGSVIASFNGSMMLPQTVVLDENGVIVYNQVGSLNYEKLEEIVLSCMEE